MVAEQRRTAAYTRLTAGEFYSNRLMLRDWDNPLPHAACGLFQQFVCDVYSRVEAQRLNWCRMNQDALRSDLLGPL